MPGTTEESGTESLDRLVHEGILRGRGGEVYEFVSEAVRVGIYSELTETRRRILHQKTGLALEAQGGTDPELARHFFLGREDAKAVEYNVRAAQAASRAFAFDTAVSHVARALEAERRRPGHTLSAEIRLLTELGRLEDELYNLHRSEELLTEAVRLARSEPGHELELGRALLAVAQTRSDRSEYASSATLATEATEILEKVGTSRDLMAAHRVLGVVNWRLGRLADAEAHQRAALTIAERDGTPSEVGHTLIDLANSMTFTGQNRLDATLDLYGRAADLFASQNDEGARARVLMNRSVLQVLRRPAGRGADRPHPGDRLRRTFAVADLDRVLLPQPVAVRGRGRPCRRGASGARPRRGRGGAARGPARIPAIGDDPSHGLGSRGRLRRGRAPLRGRALPDQGARDGGGGDGGPGPDGAERPPDGPRRRRPVAAERGAEPGTLGASNRPP